jgi:hypothetical protein
VTTADIDPFAGAEKAESLSFKDMPVGTTYTGVVTTGPKLVQSRDFNTGEPAFWPVNRPGEEPKPKMAVVINLDIDGEPRSLWAQKPSALFAALADAQKTSGAKITEGSTLSVRFTGEEAHTDPDKIRRKLPPKKLYAAKLEPAPPAAPADPFSGDASSTDATKNGWDDTPPW